MHDKACFDQTCNQNDSKCGRAKFEEVFGPLNNKLGDLSVEVFQHQKLSYQKPDGSKVK